MEITREQRPCSLQDAAEYALDRFRKHRDRPADVNDAEDLEEAMWQTLAAWGGIVPNKQDWKAARNAVAAAAGVRRTMHSPRPRLWHLAEGRA
jgi:hypothetical protein